MKSICRKQGSKVVRRSVSKPISSSTQKIIKVTKSIVCRKLNNYSRPRVYRKSIHKLKSKVARMPKNRSVSKVSPKIIIRCKSNLSRKSSVRCKSTSSRKRLSKPVEYRKQKVAKRTRKIKPKKC